MRIFNFPLGWQITARLIMGRDEADKTAVFDSDVFRNSFVIRRRAKNCGVQCYKVVQVFSVDRSNWQPDITLMPGVIIF